MTSSSLPGRLLYAGLATTVAFGVVTMVTLRAEADINKNDTLAAPDINAAAPVTGAVDDDENLSQQTKSLLNSAAAKLLDHDDDDDDDEYRTSEKKPQASVSKPQVDRVPSAVTRAS